MFNWMDTNLAYKKKLPALLLFAVFFFIGTQSAHATGNNHNDDPEATATADAAAQAQAGALAGANAEAGDARSDSAASNEGNTFDGGDNATTNTSTFFSVARSLPAAGKCFSTADGGGGNGNGAGFLGIQYLNSDCWYSALAQEERNVEVRALLKCGSKKFRNAIAYTEKRNVRQSYCVNYMTDIYVREVEVAKLELAEALLAQALMINQHTTTETERTTAQTTRAVERCTDCFGQNEK